MDLIPKPDQVVAAVGNVAHRAFYGSVADLRPMPRTLIDDGVLREVYHYRPAGTAQETGDPVLLVTPLAAPATCFDLRRGCSLVEHLVTEGRPTYLVEYGRVSFKDRNLGIEHWVDEVVPEAIRAVSEHAGGRPVHLVGWSLGGIFSVLSLAEQPDLPVASLTVVGSPFDVTQVPLVAPLRPLLNLDLIDRLGLVTRTYRALGGAPQPLVRWAFQLSAIQKHVTKPIARAVHLDDADYLAQLEAVEAFTAGMAAYPGRTFGQLYHRFVRANDLQSGRVTLGERTLDVAGVGVPTLIFGGRDDGIAPWQSVQALEALLTGSPEVRFEIVPGGHLGMLTGRAARHTTWPAIDEWLAEHESDVAPPLKAPAKRATAKKTAAKKTATKKTTAKKTTAKKTGTKRAVSGDRSAIGANPARRYDSASSRNLAT